jgi:hypothetical protein
MQSDLIADDEEKHLVFIRFVNTIHHENFMISFQNDLRTFLREKEMTDLIATILLNSEESIIIS